MQLPVILIDYSVIGQNDRSLRENVLREVMVSVLIRDYSNLVVRFLRKLYVKAQTQTELRKLSFQVKFF